MESDTEPRNDTNCRHIVIAPYNTSSKGGAGRSQKTANGSTSSSLCNTKYPVDVKVYVNHPADQTSSSHDMSDNKEDEFGDENLCDYMADGCENDNDDVKDAEEVFMEEKVDEAAAHRKSFAKVVRTFQLVQVSLILVFYQQFKR